MDFSRLIFVVASRLSHTSLPIEILDAISEKGYKKPSPIQMQCIPLGLMNRDVVGIAQVRKIIHE